MNNGEIKRGFKAFRSATQKKIGSLKTMRNCQSCVSFYADKPGAEEICHNNSVTKFDMTTEDSGKSYCTFWSPPGRDKLG